MSLNESSIPSNALGKVVFFITFQLAVCFFVGWGVIPAVILLIGYFLSKRDGNPHFLLKSIKVSQYYVYFTFVLILFIAGMVFIQSGWEEASKGLAAALVLFIIGFIYLVLINVLLKQTVLCHPSFLKSKDSFRPKKSNDSIHFNTLNIVQVENVKNTSSVDELFKLKELKDQGLISEDEFLKMKSKIMESHL